MVNLNLHKKNENSNAIDKGMSKEDAAKYAAISSAGVAAISLINPMEAQFLKNIKNVKSLASEEVTSFLNGNTTLADLSKKTIGAIIGNSAPEIAEEQFFEPVLQNVVNDSYKNQVGVNEQLDQTDVLGRENLAQSVLTATTTFLPSALESSKNMNSNSIKMNILENPENWMAIIDKKKELGIIEDDIMDLLLQFIEKEEQYDTLEAASDRKLRSFSAGEQKKEFLNYCLNQKPNYLILDNPFDHLDQGGLGWKCQKLRLVLLGGRN